MNDETPTPPPTSRDRPKRQRRLERNAAVRVELEARDLELFRLLVTLRLATFEDLHAVLGTTFSEGSLKRRLLRLFRAGYLARPPAQVLRVFEKRGGTPAVYALGNKGATELRKTGATLPYSDYDENARRLKAQTLDHRLLTSRVLACLLAGVAQRGELTLRKVLPDGQFQTTVPVSYEGRELDVKLKPDGLAVVHDREGGETVALLIEADCDTMPRERATLEQSAFFKKALTYFHYWLDAPRFREELEADDFVVLTVAETAQRAAALRETAKQVDPERRGTDIFWFTHRAELTLADPDRVLFAPIWTTAAGNEWPLF